MVGSGAIESGFHKSDRSDVVAIGPYTVTAVVEEELGMTELDVRGMSELNERGMPELDAI